jgi:hypothetical protein
MPNEQVLWQGRPQHHLWWSRNDWAFMVVGVVFAGSGVPMLFAADDAFARMFMAAFTLVFLVAPTLARPLLRAARLRSTRYAVTTHRIVVHERWIFGGVRWFSLVNLDTPVLSGDSVAMGPLPGPLMELWQVATAGRGYFWSPNPAPPPVLWHIDEAASVYTLIDTARRAAFGLSYQARPI